MIKDCLVKKKMGETMMQKSDSISSTRLQENQKTALIVSRTIAMKGNYEIKGSWLFISAMVNGAQCNLLLDTGATFNIQIDNMLK